MNEGIRNPSLINPSFYVVGFCNKLINHFFSALKMIHLSVKPSLKILIRHNEKKLSLASPPSLSPLHPALLSPPSSLALLILDRNPPKKKKKKEFYHLNRTIEGMACYVHKYGYLTSSNLNK